MTRPTPAPGVHDHRFGQDQRRPGEARTVAVILLTAATMVVEVWAGIVFGSMALLADGLHMASHAAALGVAVIAYVAARRWAGDQRARDRSAPRRAAADHLPDTGGQIVDTAGASRRRRRP